MTVMRDANTVLVNDQPFSLVDAVLNNRDLAGEIHDAFTLWCSSEVARNQGLLKAEADRADQAEKMAAEQVAAAESKTRDAIEQCNAQLDKMQAAYSADRAAFEARIAEANAAVLDAQKRVADVITQADAAVKIKADESATAIKDLAEKFNADRAKFAEYMTAQDGQVAAANDRADKSKRMQDLHWQLCTEMMAGTSETAVAVMREIERLKAMADHAATAARVEELSQFRMHEVSDPTADVKSE